jgi:hypothetical protein
MAEGKAQGKRERIDPTPDAEGGSRYVRRDGEGHFTADQVSAGRSVAQDKRTAAKHAAPRGQKDHGD